jgi:phytoene synthase
VVGVVCIRIFGYLDTRAEKLAEKTGIAFQLTNILRNVRAAAERGRLYLPLEDFERYGATASSITRASGEASWCAGQLCRAGSERLQLYGGNATPGDHRFGLAGTS